MRNLSILALLAIASPAFAEAPAEKPSTPVQGQKPVLDDRLMPKRLSPPAPETVAGTTINGQIPPEAPQPPLQSKTRGG